MVNLDGKIKNFVLYEGWLDNNGEKDPLTVSTQDLGPLKRVGGYPFPNSHWVGNLLNIDGLKILPKDCQKITWYPQGYYIACYDNGDELDKLKREGGSVYARDYKSLYWVVLADGTLLSEEPFLSATPAAFNRIRVINKYSESLVISLDGREVGSTCAIPLYSSGLFLLSGNGTQNIIDCSGNKIASDIEVVGHNSETLIYRKQGKFVVIDYTGKTLHDDFTSVLITPRSGMWEIDYWHDDLPMVVWFHGQVKNDFINYAQQVLTSSYERFALLEKDDVWYYYDVHHQLHKLGTFKTADIILPPVR